MILGELFRQAATSNPEQVAVDLPTRSLTYRQLTLLADQRALQIDRAPPSWGVVVTGEEGVANFVASLLAAWRSNRVACLVNDKSELTRPMGSALRRLADGPLAFELDELGLPGEAVVLLPTAGSSGSPRVVVHSERSLLAGLISTLTVQQEFLGLPPVTVDETGLRTDATSLQVGARFASGMPPWTIAGLTMTMRGLLVGESIAFLRTTSGAALLQDFARFEPTAVSLPGLAAHRLARTRPEETGSASMPLSVGIGGGSVSKAACSDIETRWGCIVSRGYGSTELGGPVLMTRPNDSAEQRWTTVGTPLHDIEVKLEPIRERPETTELFVRSPSRCLGILTAENFVPFEGDWYQTGDIADVDERGYFRIRGRLDGMLTRGGRQFDLVEIQNDLEGHPSVSLAAAVALESNVPGEFDLAAAVVPAGTRYPDLLELRRWIRRHDASKPSLRTLRVVSELPVAADGNIATGLVRSAFVRES